MTGGTNGNGKKIQLGIAIVVVAVIAVGGLFWWHNLRTRISTDNAKVDGKLVEVSPKVAGRVDSILVTNGQTVQAGQVLARLDDSQYLINLQQAKAALDLAQATYSRLPDDVRSAAAAVQKSKDGVTAAAAQVNSAQSTLADAGRQLKNNQSLYASGAISKEAFDTAQSNYDKAKAGVDAAVANAQASQAGMVSAQAALNTLNNSQAAIYLAQIEQAQAAYDNAKLAEANTTVKATASGTVLRIPIEAGENVSAGQTIMTISDLHGTWVTTNVDEDKFGRIKVGQQAEVTIDAYPGKTFAGKVVETGNATQSTFSLISTENTSGNYTKVTQRLQVKIKVKEDGYSLKPGMSAVVTIHTT